MCFRKYIWFLLLAATLGSCSKGIFLKRKYTRGFFHANRHDATQTRKQTNDSFITQATRKDQPENSTVIHKKQYQKDTLSCKIIEIANAFESKKSVIKEENTYSVTLTMNAKHKLLVYRDPINPFDVLSTKWVIDWLTSLNLSSLFLTSVTLLTLGLVFYFLAVDAAATWLSVLLYGVCVLFVFFGLRMLFQSLLSSDHFFAKIFAFILYGLLAYWALLELGLI